MLILEEIYTELRVGLFNILDWTFLISEIWPEAKITYNAAFF